MMVRCRTVRSGPFFVCRALRAMAQPHRSTPISQAKLKRCELLLSKTIMNLTKRHAEACNDLSSQHDLVVELLKKQLATSVWRMFGVSTRHAVSLLRSGGAQSTTAGLRHLLRVPGASTRLSQIGISIWLKAAVDQVQAQAIAVVANGVQKAPTRQRKRQKTDAIATPRCRQWSYSGIAIARGVVCGWADFNPHACGCVGGDIK